MDRGFVGFSARAATGDRPATRWVPIACLQPAGAAHALDVRIPAETDALEITVFHRGNGTVWFDGPDVAVGTRRIERARRLGAVVARPLSMPAVQRMDYRAEPVQDAATGRAALRITAVPLLDQSLDAARSAASLVDELLRVTDLPKVQEDWVRQLARLVVQALAWRTLTESNHDVFLAENLLWLHRTAFPDRRVLALGHTSHTEQRPGKMGTFVAEALGDAYRTVSMVVGGGSYRDFGEVSKIAPGADLDRFDIDPAALPEIATTLGGLQAGSFLVRLAGVGGVPGLDPARLGPHLPDVIVYLREVEALRRLP